MSMIETVAYEPKQLLLARSEETNMRGVTLVAGKKYLAGTVIGKDANGKGDIVNLAGAVKVAWGVLAMDVDATSAEQPGNVYLNGTFNVDALIFGGTDTYAAHEEELRNISIYAEKLV